MSIPSGYKVISGEPKPGNTYFVQVDNDKFKSLQISDVKEALVNDTIPFIKDLFFHSKNDDDPQNVKYNFIKNITVNNEKKGYGIGLKKGTELIGIYEYSIFSQLSRFSSQSATGGKSRTKKKFSKLSKRRLRKTRSHKKINTHKNKST